jgi:3',5'-cyclic AMP phosphodiesterase CpdA
MNTPHRIMHVSDLHFGKTSPHVFNDLKKFIEENQKEIHLLVLTGDITQRARHHEFLAARKFLDELPVKAFLIPGNHDIPAFNLLERFTTPHKKFCRYFGTFAERFYEDEDVAVYGFWSTNHFTVESPILRPNDLKDALSLMNQSKARLKLIASHHPLTRSQIFSSDLKQMMKEGCRLFLSGHEHQSWIKEIVPGAYALAAGTSASSRTRIESNSFNLITSKADGVEIEVHHHDPDHPGFRVTLNKFLALT